MSEKKYTGNFYGGGKPKETPDTCPSCMYQKKEVETDVEECPSCMYQKKDVEKDVEECPNCFYTSSKDDKDNKA